MKKKEIVSYLRETMSVKEIAQQVGVSERLVRYWVKGEKNPSRLNMNHLEGLAKERIGGSIDKKEEIEAAEKANEKQDMELIKAKKENEIQVKKEDDLFLANQKQEEDKGGKVGLKGQLDELDSKEIARYAIWRKSIRENIRKGKK